MHLASKPPAFCGGLFCFDLSILFEPLPGEGGLSTDEADRTYTCGVGVDLASGIRHPEITGVGLPENWQFVYRRSTEPNDR